MTAGRPADFLCVFMTSVLAEQSTSRTSCVRPRRERELLLQGRCQETTRELLMRGSALFRPEMVSACRAHRFRRAHTRGRQPGSWKQSCPAGKKSACGCSAEEHNRSHPALGNRCAGEKWPVYAKARPWPGFGTDAASTGNGRMSANAKKPATGSPNEQDQSGLQERRRL
jgi:hypothetical protein